MRQRLIHWIFQRGKSCGRCCLWCRHYGICRADVLARDKREENHGKGERGNMRNFRLDDEGGQQEALFGWAGYQLGRMPELEYLHHVPNGGKRDRATATALKRQGVKAGVPDIVLPAVRAGYHGLYIELKAGKNTATDNQKRWLGYLRQQGYYTAVCYGWQAAAGLIERYLLKPEELQQSSETITMR